MLIRPTPLAGAALIDVERMEDDRGFFARAFCRQEFLDAGLDPVVEQTNISFNRRAGTLRGMHFQRAPHSEAKLVRCTRGAIHDVVIDLRPDSGTYLQHLAAELTQDNRTALYVPRDFAHGFVTLVDDTEVHYQMSTAFVPGVGAGFRYDDPALGIDWPVEPVVVSPRDADWPLLHR